MPGHVKKSTGPDEDPLPYLVVSIEMKREDMMKPYDSKKSYWVPDGKGGYVEGKFMFVISYNGLKMQFLYSYKKKI